MNLFALLDQTAARHGDRGAVYLGTRQLHTWQSCATARFAWPGPSGGAHPAGTRIAVASENRPELVELMFATWAAECVIVPINYKLHALEMAQILDDSGAAMVFASSKIAAGLSGVTEAPVEDVTSTEYASRLTGPPAAPPRDTDPTTLAWLFYTSGTTGRSKGAMLSHRNLMAMTVSHLADFDNPDARLQSRARRADVARLRALHRPLRAARCAPGDPGVGGLRTRRVPRPLRPPSGLQQLPGPDHGAAPRADRTPVPEQSAHGGLRRWSDVRRQPEEGDGGLRPDLRSAVRPGRGADDDHGTAPRRPPGRRRRGPGLGRLRTFRGRRRSA